jgi:hypothetical protein
MGGLREPPVSADHRSTIGIPCETERRQGCTDVVPRPVNWLVHRSPFGRDQVLDIMMMATQNLKQ